MSLTGILIYCFGLLLGIGLFSCVDYDSKRDKRLMWSLALPLVVGWMNGIFGEWFLTWIIAELILFGVLMLAKKRREAIIVLGWGAIAGDPLIGVSWHIAAGFADEYFLYDAYAAMYEIASILVILGTLYWLNHRKPETKQIEAEQ